MTTYKFADFFNPNKDPNFNSYNEYLFSLLDVLNPLFKNRITELDILYKNIFMILRDSKLLRK